LLLPPGYKDEVPVSYFVYRPLTNNVFVFGVLSLPTPPNSQNQ